MAHSSSSHREAEGQVHEDTKHALIFKGTKTSETINEVLKELNQLRAPHAKYWSRRHNEKLNFDNTNSISFLCNVNNCALFAFGTHNKKRPHNLVMGRTFNGQVLDMVELGIDKHVPVDAKEIGKTRLGSKPLVVFLGAQWRKHDALGRLQNFFLDFFHGGEIDALNLNGIDRLVGITALPPKETPKDEGESVLKGTGYRIHIAHYSVRLNKGAGKDAMDVELTPTGPALHTVIRRTNLAPNDVFKAACKRPKQDMKQTVKNVSHDEFGNTRGQIHVQTQDVTALQTKQFRANRVARKRARAEDRAERAAAAPGVEVEQRQKKRSRKE